MKKTSILKKSILLLSLLSCFFAGQMKGQTLLWGSSPFQDSLWSVDTTTWAVVNRIGPTLAGFTITGMNGLAYDPLENDCYVIMKVSGVTGRVLGKINLSTGVCTQVGNLGDNFSTISFREDGQLFGVTGDGGSVPETLFLIDKTTGAKTLAAALGAGADGEVISYNWNDDFFYHWSGNGTIVFEKVMSVAPYTATNIPTTGTTNGETFGAIYIGNNNFIISNISGSFNHCNGSGAWTAAFGSNPDDLRGLVIPPVTTFAPAGPICVNDSANWTFRGMIGYNGTIIYSWGDGSADDTLAVPGNMSHTYTTAGTFTAYSITLVSGQADTLSTASIVVNPLPAVAITPDPAYICAGDTSVDITGTFGGTSQWYKNGVIIGGATSNVFTVTASNLGLFNMTKINMNGCIDSAAVGVTVDFAPALLMLSSGDTICSGDSIYFNASPGADTYQWYLNGSQILGATADSVSATLSGTYSVMASFSNCTDSTGGADLVLKFAPIASFTQSADTVSLDTSGTVGFTDGSTNPISWAWNFGDTGTSTTQDPSHNYTVPGSYTVTLITTNDCGSDTSTSTVVVLDTIVGISNQLAGGSIAIYPNPNNGQFNIDFSSLKGQDVSVVVTDLRGVQIMNEFVTVASGKFTRSYDISGAAQGFYLVSLTAGSQTVTGKIMVK